MLFLILFALRLRSDSLLTTLLFLTFGIRATAFHPSILNPDDTVRQLCDLFIVCDHYDRLTEPVRGNLHQTQNILTRPGIQISRWLIRQHNGGLRRKRPGDGHTLLLSPESCDGRL